MIVIANIRKFINNRFVSYLLILYAIYFLYNKFIINTSEIFQGAFFAVFVSYLTFLLTKLHELTIKRFNAMVYLEQEMYYCINALSDNLFQIQKALDSDQITAIFPVDILLSENHVKELGRIGLKQDLAFLFIGINKMNHSIDTVVKIFERNLENLKELTSSDERQRMIILFINDYKDKLRELSDFGKQLDEEIKDVLIKLRFFLNVDKPLFSSKFLMNYYSKYNYQEWLVEDKKRLNIELLGKGNINPRLSGWLFIPGYPQSTETTTSSETE